MMATKTVLLAVAIICAFAQESHVAFILSRGQIEDHQSFFLHSLLREIDELQLNDISIKQKSEFARITGLVSNIKLGSIDFEQSRVQMDFIADDQPLSEACSQKDVQISVTISNFSLELEFMDWFEVAA